MYQVPSTVRWTEYFRYLPTWTTYICTRIITVTRRVHTEIPSSFKYQSKKSTLSIASEYKKQSLCPVVHHLMKPLISEGPWG